MSNVFLGLITLAFVTGVIFFIVVMLELRNTVRNLNDLIRNIESRLNPAIEELQQTLRSLRNVSDNITGVTEDVRVLSGSVRKIGEDARRVSGFIEEVTSSAVVRVSGWRAGITAALQVIAQGLLSGKKR